MATTEEVFLSTKDILAKQIEEATREALDKIYFEYLPHVENDTNSNVYFQTCEWLEAFFDGTLNENDNLVKFDISRRYSSEKARQKIYEANKEEIHAAIGRDLQDEIDRLKDNLKFMSRNY